MKITIITLGLILSVGLQADILDDAESTIQNGNPQKGMQMYNNACQTGNSKACKILGAIHFEGFEGLAKKSTKKAIPYFTQACKRNDLEACDMLGGIYLVGRGIPQDLSKATYFFKKTCYQGHLKGCASAANALSMAKKPQQALPLYSKACQGKLATSCLSVGMMYILGEGTQRNISHGKKYLSNSCTLGNQEACNTFRSMNEAGM